MTDKIDSDVLLIDRNALDLELMRQAQTYYEVAEAYTEAASKRDAASEAIKQIDAQVYFELRTQYEADNVKITESLLSQKVLAHPSHMKAHSEYTQLKLQSDQLAALKDAFAQRAYMLRDLVQLHTTGYFTESSVSGKTNAVEDIRYLNARSQISELIKKGSEVKSEATEKSAPRKLNRRTVNS